MRGAIAFLLATSVIAGCTDRELRGTADPSPDSLTYLLVQDDNGCSKGDLLVDGKPWPYPTGTAGLISPGEHKISCGGEISFTIPAHKIFRFNYWGP
jgi:hypothetical protein